MKQVSRFNFLRRKTLFTNMILILLLARIRISVCFSFTILFSPNTSYSQKRITHSLLRILSTYNMDHTALFVPRYCFHSYFLSYITISYTLESYTAFNWQKKYSFSVLHECKTFFARGHAPYNSEVSLIRQK